MNKRGDILMVGAFVLAFAALSTTALVWQVGRQAKVYQTEEVEDESVEQID